MRESGICMEPSYSAEIAAFWKELHISIMPFTSPPLSKMDLTSDFIIALVSATAVEPEPFASMTLVVSAVRIPRDLLMVASVVAALYSPCNEVNSISLAILSIWREICQFHSSPGFAC